MVLSVVQDGDDVGMDEAGGDVRLLLEPVPHAGEHLRLRPQDLHRHRAFESLVEGVEERAIPPSPSRPMRR